MGQTKTYLYFTEVIAQQGKYTVKHETLEDMQKYEQKLKDQWPYFRKIKNGKL